MSAESDSDNGESTITNLGTVEEMYEEKQEKDRERALDRAKDLSTERWLEGKLDEQASPVDIYGREFLFRPVSNDAVERALEVASNEAEKIDAEDIDGIEDIETDQLEDMPELIRTMRGILDEHCVGVPDGAEYEPMTTSDWKKVPFARLETFFERVAMSTGMNAQEAERASQFRGE